MSLGTRWSVPFYSGAATSVALLTRSFPVAVNGRPYLVDSLLQDAFGREFITSTRQQYDAQLRPGKGSISPEQLWRRDSESWHLGSGQSYFDRDDSDPSRFASSKGIDPWTKYGIGLLNATASVRTSVNTNLAFASAGTTLYVADGNALYKSTDLSTFTDVVIYNGEAVTGDLTSVCSDGYNVWAALGSNGVHTTTRGAAGSTHYNALAATVVAYTRGRLMAAAGAAIYNITAGGAAPAALFGHNNTDFTWVGFAGGLNRIYAAGYSGDKSEVYKIAIKADASGLDVPVPALPGLPDGEIVRSISAYLGFVLIGSDKGVRFCTADSNGDLTLGALIPTASAVRCFEGQDRFVWYGLTNYDSTSTGLGRLDLANFTDTQALTPAYATDLMATAQGDVLDVCTFGDVRVFAVSGVGIYQEQSTKVTSGTLTLGEITYGLLDPKVPLYLDMRHDALPAGASVQLSLSTDGAAATSLGVSAVEGSIGPTAAVQGEQSKGERFNVTVVLGRATDTTTGPRVTRLLLRSHVVPERIQLFSVPLLLHESMEDLDGSAVSFDVKTERAALEALVKSGLPVIYQEGSESYTVLPTGARWMPRDLNQQNETYQGTLVMTFKEAA